MADLLTDHPNQLDHPAGLFLVAAGSPAPLPGAARIAIESHWMPTGKNAGRIVIKLAESNSINDAERFAGMTLMLPALDRPPLDEDTFYVSDLIGSTLYRREAAEREATEREATERETTERETPIGEVVDVEFATSPDGRTRLADAAPLLSVRATADAEPFLVPFVRAHLISVDTESRRIVMHLPDGLVEAGTTSPDHDPQAEG